MGVREAMNRHPRTTMAVIVPVILLAVGSLVYWQRPEKPLKPQTRMFYTVDDGKTWFADSVKKTAPFLDKDGNEAVVAYVYQCGGQKPFVAYMERMTPEAKKRVDEIKKQGVGPGNGPEMGKLLGVPE